ncbi:MAG: elongation factor G [Verrucomicrobiota bacterium]|nr:elongation factor G [Verrucomicrobiota bacterium]
MKGYTTEKTRNFCIAGHSGAGKTTLSDLILYKTGASDRFGKVKAKNSVSDYREEEKDRGHSIFATPLHCTWKENLLYFIDVPGYNDFQGEALSALHVCNSAVIVVDALAGIEVGTIHAWKHSKTKPHLFFVNGLDKDGADFFKVLKALQKNYGSTVCVPFTMPIGKEKDFSDVIHILRSDDVPAELSDEAEKYKEAIMDTIAESDDELMERYLDGEELSEEEISKGLHEAINAGDLIPVFSGSADKEIGCNEFLNGLVNLLPNPSNAMIPTLKEEKKIEFSDKNNPVGYIFKSMTDPFVGQLTFMKVISGTFTADMDIINTTQHSKERFGQFYVVNGKNQTTTDEAAPGEIVAIPKLKNTKLGDTLVCKGSDVEVLFPKYPTPTVSFAIYAVKKGEEEKIAQALHKIADEDPTVILEQQQETHESLIHGMGDLQFAIIADRVKKDGNVEMDFRTPKIPYRETITAIGDDRYRHKKQSGGAGQFGEVFMRVEPIEEEYEFVSEIVGGNIPKNYFPAIEKGVKEAMLNGPLANCKVINVKSVIYDGKHHDVDSNEMAFKIAGRGAFRAAMAKAKPILLEPIMHIKVMIPDEYMGDVNGDINTRRGRIMGMQIEEGMQILEAEVPQSELSNYTSSLRSITQGKGTVAMEFARYEKVPANIADQIKKGVQSHDEE